MAKIINLDDVKTQQVVYTKENNLFDNETGEVITQENTFIKKELKKDQFIKLFLDNIVFWVNLDNKEKNMLFCAINQMNWFNVVKIDAGFRKASMAFCDISRNTVSTAINSLIEKNIFIKLSEDDYIELGKTLKGEAFVNIFSNTEYLINPQIVGKGSFRDLRKIRQTIIQDFDFETMEMKKQVIQEANYDGFNEVIKNPQNHTIKNIKQDISESKKIKNTEIVIAEKEPVSDVIDAEEIKTTQEPKKQPNLALNSSNADAIKLELIKEQNRAKELDIQKGKIDNENLKLRIQLSSMNNHKSILNGDPSYIPNPNDEDF